eukprot:792708-Alexandrium_andersonii.AAC.1
MRPSPPTALSDTWQICFLFSKMLTSLLPSRSPRISTNTAAPLFEWVPSQSSCLMFGGSFGVAR